MWRLRSACAIGRTRGRGGFLWPRRAADPAPAAHAAAHTEGPKSEGTEPDSPQPRRWGRGGWGGKRRPNWHRPHPRRKGGGKNGGQRPGGARPQPCGRRRSQQAPLPRKVARPFSAREERAFGFAGRRGSGSDEADVGRRSGGHGCVAPAAPPPGEGASEGSGPRRVPSRCYGTTRRRGGFLWPRRAADPVPAAHAAAHTGGPKSGGTEPDSPQPRRVFARRVRGERPATDARRTNTPGGGAEATKAAQAEPSSHRHLPAGRRGDEGEQMWETDESEGVRVEAVIG